jgi:hypothetical protein
MGTALALPGTVVRPLSVTVSPDEAPVPRFLVKLLVVTVSFGLGVCFTITTRCGLGDDPATETARREARSLADELRVADTCTDSLTRLGERLVEDGRDPWGRRWSVRCHGELGVVRSAGADARWRTPDDVIALSASPP